MKIYQFFIACIVLLVASPSLAQEVKPAAQSQEAVAIQVLQNQRNAALDGTAQCYIDSNRATTALRTELDAVRKELADAKAKLPKDDPKPEEVK